MIIKKVATGKAGLYNITEDVKEAVKLSGIKEGLCVVYVPDNDAALMVTSYSDKTVHEDIFEDYERIFPAHNKQNFKGDLDEGSAHAKSAVTGVSVDIAIHDGEAVFGCGQGIFVADFDGLKAEREVYVKCI